MKCFYLIVFVLSSLPTLASTAVERNLQTVISESFPEETFLQGFSQGALDEEGHRYVAALTSNQYNDTRLVVLRLQSPEAFKIVAHTQQEVAIGRSIFSVKISNRSILMSVYSSGGCCSYSDTTYQFKKVADRFMLVGAEEIYRAMEDRTPTDTDTNMEKHYQLRHSVNFLTNKVIHSRRSWNAYSFDNEKPVGKPRYAEVTLGIDKPAPIAIELQSFSLDAYNEFVLATRSLCGSLGKNLKFEPYSICKADGQHP